MRKLLLLIILAIPLYASSFNLLFQTSGNDTANARRYYNLMLGKMEADSGLAIGYARQAIAFAQKGKAEKLEADVYDNLGRFYSAKVRRALSDSFFRKALNIRAKLKDSMGMANAIMNLGHNNYDHDDFANALQFYLKAAAIRQKINDKKGLAGSYIWIGNIYYEGLINYNNAKYYFNKAQALYTETKDEAGLGFVYSNLANVLMLQKLYPEALKYYLKAIDVKNRLHSERGLGVIYNNVGNLYFNQKQYNKALAFYFRSLAIRQKQDDKAGIATSDVNIANTWFVTNTKPDSTRILLDQAVSISKAINFKQGIADGSYSLFEVYQKQKDYHKAIAYYQQHVLYKDSILNENSARQINDMQTKFETAAKEQQIMLLHSENTIQKLDIKKRNTTIAVISGLLVVLFIIGALFYNRYKLKQEARLQNEVIRQQELAAKGIIEAEERERKRIAGDLHDGVGQLFTAVKMNLEILMERFLVKKADADILAEKTMAMVDESCTEVRSIAHQMMPNALIKGGLVSALHDFVNKIPPNKLKIAIETKGMDEGLDSTIETVLYRVIQESVNNALKHAEASMLDILLLCDKKEITVSIEDNGKGFDAR